LPLSGGDEDHRVETPECSPSVAGTEAGPTAPTSTGPGRIDRLIRWLIVVAL